MSDHLKNWAETTLSTPIELFSSAALSQLDRPLLFIGGTHGDEPLGVRLAQELLAWLRAQKATAVCPWIMIPCINPDGFAKQTRVNGRGVDLNRNYPASNWSPVARAERYNPGPAPASEVEIQALVALIEQTRPRLLVHFHSWNPCVVCTGAPGRKDAQRLAQSSGYERVDTIGYDTPGSLSQYGWFDKKIPVLCIEEQDDSDPEATWPRFRSGLIAICQDLSERSES